MKNSHSITIFIILFLLIEIAATTKNKNTNSLRSHLKSLSKNKQESISQLQDLWSQLFKTERGSSCSKELFKPDISNNKDVSVSNEKAVSKLSGWGLVRPSFTWIKKWGFGSAAYLIDFLDPVYMKDFITETGNILKDIKKYNRNDTSTYSDAFNIMFIAPLGRNMTSDTDFKKIDPEFTYSMHNNSINTVQLNDAISDWSWTITTGAEDPAYEFVGKYDINGDGRLNTNELVLGVIWSNRNRDDLFCYNCYFLIAKKISAMFSFLDCSSKGYLTAEELWNKLPTLVRGTTKYNIFKTGTKDTIRTSAVNDFILKNGFTIDGGITRNEFISGILLAYWQRHTKGNNIIEDESLSLRNLRWANQGEVDIRAVDFLNLNTAS